MYNSTKYLVSKILGLIAIGVGAISLFISVLALLSFTKGCVGMTFEQLGLLLVLVGKSAADVLLVKKGLISIKDPKRLLASENEKEKRYKWYYSSDDVNIAILVAGLSAVVAAVIDFLFFNTLYYVFAGLSMIVLIVLCLMYVAVIALEIVNINIKDVNLYDKNGDLIIE